MIVVDTGVLVAAINKRDKFHESCAHFLVTTAEPLVVPAMVITEGKHSAGLEILR